MSQAAHSETDSTQYLPRPAQAPPSYRFEVISESPSIHYVRNFLSMAECDFLIEHALPKMKRSVTVNPETGEFFEVDARTSQGTYYDRGENEVVARIEERLAKISSLPVENGEGLQVIHYKPGQEYKPHHDYFDPEKPGSVKVLETGGQRLVTVIMYLSDVEAGGETAFPIIQATVKPVKGDAVMFFNTYGNGQVDPNTLHGGLPVIEGEKWICTKWIRERKY